MQLDEIYWIFPLVTGVPKGIFVCIGAWRQAIFLILFGAGFVTTGLLFGLTSEFSMARGVELLAFDKRFIPREGSCYRLIGVGYMFLLIGAILCIRRIFANPLKDSSNPPNSDARQVAPRGG